MAKRTSASAKKSARVRSATSGTKAKSSTRSNSSSRTTAKKSVSSRKTATAAKAKKKVCANKKAGATARTAKKSAPKPKKTSKRVTAKVPSSNKTAVKRVTTSSTLAAKTSRAGAKQAAAGPAYTIGTLAIYDDNRPLPKTKLSAKDLEEFTGLLLTKRRELVGDMGNLAGEALGRNRQEASGDLSAMPIHMADIGSDTWEQEFTLGLIDNERKVLREIDEALARIEARTYGVCLATHKPISKARLRAKPWAKYCIEYAKLREAGRVPHD